MLLLRLCTTLSLGLLVVGQNGLDPRLQKLAEQGELLESYEDRMLAAIEFLTSNATLKAEWEKHLAEASEREAQATYGLSDFPCETGGTKDIPTSVHALTPGSIKVIGTIGDSLSAGSGIGALTPLGILIPFRGRTFGGGGDKTLEKYLTLPNILKKYNPSLYGYATGVGSYMFPNAHFNQAVPAAISNAMPNQAQRLVNRMKNSKKIDFENDWKVITIFIGGNDVCSSCKPKNKGKREPEMYVDNIKGALDIIHDNVPRAFVNVILMLHVELLEHMSPGIVCQAMHLLECSCGAYPESPEASKELRDLTQKYIDQLDALVTSGRYNTRDDFTVVSQPFFTETELPRKEDGSPDMSYFAPDCFHLSQKGQEAAALSLWNNMIEPVAEKKRSWYLGEQIECPTRTQPFIATYKNSPGLHNKSTGNLGAHAPADQDSMSPYDPEVPHKKSTGNLGAPAHEDPMSPYAPEVPQNDKQSGSPVLGITLGSVGAVLLVLVLGTILVRRMRKPRHEYEALLLQ